MFKQLIAFAIMAVVAQAADSEEPKVETFEDVVKELPSIHFTSKPGPAAPGLYNLIMK